MSQRRANTKSKNTKSKNTRVTKTGSRTNRTQQSSESPKRYQCPFCFEIKPHHGLRNAGTTGLSRVDDLLRHLEAHHSCDVQYQCNEDGCGDVFRWKQACEAHYKEEHSDIVYEADKITEKPYLQLVFACGFKDCGRTFEPSGSNNANQVRKKYFKHIKDHYKDGYTIVDWSYSSLIRNLMRNFIRQSGLKGKWKDLPEDLHWELQSTAAGLQKALETRQTIHNPEHFVSEAVELGSQEITDQQAMIVDQLPHAEGSGMYDGSGGRHQPFEQVGSLYSPYGSLQQGPEGMSYHHGMSGEAGGAATLVDPQLALYGANGAFLQQPLAPTFGEPVENINYVDDMMPAPPPEFDIANYDLDPYSQHGYTPQ